MPSLTGQATRAFGLLLVFGLVIGACTNGGAGENSIEVTEDAGPTQTPPTRSEPTTTVSATTSLLPLELRPHGGEVVIGTTLEPSTLNKFAQGGFSSVVALIGNAYWAGVQDIDGVTLELIPDLVTDLPTVANGGITINSDQTETIRYTIRDEAVWADGQPITGFDFEFTYETIMNPDLAILRTDYEDIVPESVVAEEKTFEFTLETPTLRAELLFGTILPKHDIGGADFLNDYNDHMWLSAGPFVLEEWQRGEFISLTRNPNYWKTDSETGQQLPYLDRVIVRFFPDAASLIGAFEAGDVDVISPPPTVPTIDELWRLESEGAAVQVRAMSTWEHLGFQFGSNRSVVNPNSYNEFLEYRKAVAHAIDRNRIVDEILDGEGRSMNSYVEAYSPNLSQGAWDQYDYDTEKARGYLADLCARQDTNCDARPVTAVFTTIETNDLRVALSVLLGEMLEDVGIAYEVRLEDPLAFFGDTLDFGLFDVGGWAWQNRTESASLSSLVAIHDVWNPDAPPGPGFGVLNTYRWGTPAVAGIDLHGFNQPASSIIDGSTVRFAELRDQMNDTVDERELIDLIHEAENILADSVVFIPLYQQLDLGAVWTDKIGGYLHAPPVIGDTWNVGRWYRADLAS